MDSILRAVLRHPRFASELPGPHLVSSIARVRLEDAVCATSISYPSAAHAATACRIPYFSSDAVKGLADYARKSPATFRHLQAAYNPSAQGCAPLSPPDGQKWPVIIFSHGLGGCADTYTELCRSLASFGYIVIAMEHEDGSGCHAQKNTGEQIRYRRPDSTPYSRAKVTNFRAPFIQQRVQELEDILPIIRRERKREGTTSEHADTLDAILQLTDKSRVVLVGHSFGAASFFVAAHELATKQPPTLAVLLDAWAFSLDDAVLEATPKPDATPVPLLSILSEEWTSNKEVFAVDKLLKASSSAGSLCGSYFVPQTVHHSFSDSSLWFPVSKFLENALYAAAPPPPPLPRSLLAESGGTRNRQMRSG